MTKRITTVEELQQTLGKLKSDGKSIGFVPTMGALHNGHMTLIDHSVKENDVTVSSIFVNPTQFNDKNDLKKYPRTEENDIKLLNEHSADYAFIPSVTEIYPNGSHYSIDVNLDGLDRQMEGAFRPGHFEGVVQVVNRLLEIVQPHNLYMGQKDFQQFSIIAKMISYLNLDVQLRVVPIVRENDGLAMSSRNVRLPEDSREVAPEIYKVLKAVNRKKYELTVSELEAYAINRLEKQPLFKPEYFSIVDGHTLTPIQSVKDADYVVACTAVWTGDIRLIDNMVLKKPRGLKLFVRS